MFVHSCTSCHQRKLVFPNQVTSLVNTHSGIVVSYTCWCGAGQTWVTGRAAAPTERAPVAA
ncbi:MAG: hypothetical protein H0V42_05285 [Nocardioidaceae bacterium]|nr:hypothetical protein [Nocardioidaceae bacterium]